MPFAVALAIACAATCWVSYRQPAAGDVRAWAEQLRTGTESEKRVAATELYRAIHEAGTALRESGLPEAAFHLAKAREAIR
jgi:hypothetical protein